ADLSLYSTSGKQMRVIEFSNVPAGLYSRQVDLEDVEAGIYFIKLEIDDRNIFTRRIVKQ
ncbi:MAG: T9SS type A sorting domain-containing protein, partial [Chitinophagales bacterium]|nr:T9SS type A sorting domain-containing protein [Chitinophagales bacterium]